MQQEATTPANLLASAAKKILRQAGLQKKGRSRVWLADQGWWMIVVEFQPSGFAKGSYLNVGCLWLWDVKSHESFDLGYRVEELSHFQTDAQITPIAESLANQALAKVQENRDSFRTVDDLSDYFRRNAPKDFWGYFNASIAHSLAGRVEIAAKSLSHCLAGAVDDDPAWLVQARSGALKISTIIRDPEQTRDLIASRVHETRMLRKMTPLASIHFTSETNIPA